VTPSFQGLVQANPELGTSFIREVCLRIGVPSADEKQAPSPRPEPTTTSAQHTSTSLADPKQQSPSTRTSDATMLNPVPDRDHYHAHGPANPGGAGVELRPSDLRDVIHPSSAPWTPVRRAVLECPSSSSPTTPPRY
jgi:hypothetical protein